MKQDAHTVALAGQLSIVLIAASILAWRHRYSCSGVTGAR